MSQLVPENGCADCKELGQDWQVSTWGVESYNLASDEDKEGQDRKYTYECSGESRRELK